MSAPGSLEVVAAYRTDPGLVRETNQDWAEIFWADDAALAARKGNLFLVADGMGGHASGEQVSKFAVQKVGYVYRRDPSPDVKASLRRAIAQANAEIYREAMMQVGEVGAGTTIVGVVIRDRRAFVVNIGDSRAYRVRAGRIEQITRDHSWVAEQMRAGRLAEQQLQRHELRSTVTRAVGTEPSVTPDFFELDVQPGDVFVLCTDGLTRHVSDADIQAIVSRYLPEEAANRLVQLARQRGGTDNVTAMVIQVKRPAIGAEFRISKLFDLDWWRHRLPPSMRSLPLVVGVLLIVLLVLSGLMVWMVRSWVAAPTQFDEPLARQGPIWYRVLRDTTVEELASRFGYEDVSSFQRAVKPIHYLRGDPISGSVPAGTKFFVQPTQSYYLVGGRFEGLIEESGRSILEVVARKGRYRILIPDDWGQKDSTVKLGKGDLLRIFGVQPVDARGEPKPRALLIMKQNRERSAWLVWYRSESLPRDEIWVYGSLTEGSFGPDIIATTQHPGKPVAVYGRWIREPEVGAVAFRWGELYILNAEGNAYVPAGQPAEEKKAQPTRQPTATLRPTEMPGR